MHEDLPSPAAPDIVGFVDGIVRGRLCGWAYDRTSPRHRLTVAAWDPSGRQRLVLADRYRADVQQSGHGDGYCGFVLPLAQSSDVEGVRVVSTRPAVELTFVPNLRGTEAAAPKVFTVGAYTLQVDMPPIPGQISGWAVDRQRPQDRRALRLCADGHAIRRQRATLYRGDVADGFCDGYHGFLFTLPGSSMQSLALEDVGMSAMFRIWP